MALDTRLSISAVNAQASATGALCDGGYLRIYPAPRRALLDDAPAGPLLAELRFAAIAFGDPVNGVITANPITAEDAALASGDAEWFAAVSADGETQVFDGSIGITESNLVLPTVTIPAGIRIEIDSLTYTQPQTGA
jgi:hypothetical protein